MVPLREFEGLLQTLMAFDNITKNLTKNIAQNSAKQSSEKQNSEKNVVR